MNENIKLGIPAGTLVVAKFIDSPDKVIGTLSSKKVFGDTTCLINFIEDDIEKVTGVKADALTPYWAQKGDIFIRIGVRHSWGACELVRIRQQRHKNKYHPVFSLRVIGGDLSIEVFGEEKFKASWRFETDPDNE